MVVISEDDVICRSCGILVNTLDRLETEMRQAQNYILHFLEKKYSLADGELRGYGDKPKPCQPPQITRSETTETCDLNSLGKKILTKSQIWLQCNKCKYTTHHDSFMMHHMKDHNEERAADEHIFESQQESERHSYSKVNDLENKENETDNSDIVIKDDKAMEVTLLEPIQSVFPITQSTSPPLLDLSNCNHLYASDTLPASVSTLSQEQMYVLQPIDTADIENLKKMTRLDSEQKMEVKSENRKRITLKEDGSLELVEMPWNETEGSNTIDTTMVFD
ncbi:uncharacterized protein LOC105207811 isoform X2 [Solenopsis invicta]|nr:uncharacterized protein LOC105207811 isoform X2 [Solenopsis invicta]